jgi:subtilisin-like proprotein convertase family protein
MKTSARWLLIVATTLLPTLLILPLTEAKLTNRKNLASLSSVSRGPITITRAARGLSLGIVAVPVIEPDGSALTAESCVPFTGAVDPAETVTVDLTLKNNGASDTSNLVATLQATGGVTSPGPPQSYGVVVAGGPSVTRSFTFTVDFGLACGDVIIATLQLQDGATNLGTVTYNFTTGALSAPRPVVNYSSGNITVPIPDVSTVDVPIDVTDVGVVHDINVRVRLNHSFDGDLEIRLVHPDGTAVLLSNKRGGGGDNFGAGANDCSGTPTLFDDSSLNSILGGVAPFAGSFRPEQALSSLNGKAISGTWKLRITDTASGDVGTIGCAQLDIVRREHLCCPFTDGQPTIDPAPPTTVTAESCNPPNNAIDPDEVVTVEFPLRNVGTAPTASLVATLLPGGGVTPQSGPQNYGQLSPVDPGSTASRPFTFRAHGSCGSNVTATLHLQDGATDLGTVTFTFTLGEPVLNTTTLSNLAPITLPDSPRVSGVALASSYPSTINVAGLVGTVTKVTVALKDFNHTNPDDVDVLLVGPGGQRVVLMSDAGGAPNQVNTTFTFDDTAPAAVPDTFPGIFSDNRTDTGTFKPSNYVVTDIFPAPAPAGPHPDPPLLSVFNGIDPNGVWSLLVVDDASVNAGSILGGWELRITTEVRVCCENPCTLTCPADIVVSNDAGQCGANVNFSAEAEGSCGVVTYSHQPGSFFPVGTTEVTATETRADGGTQSCTFKVTVNDTEAPVVSDVSASPSLLGPPNHKMRNVAINYSVADNCPAAGAISCSIFSITSNEPDNGTGDGDTAPDWEIVDNHQVKLRAERSGLGTGRVYTITVRCTNDVGNHTFRTVTVTVPLN